MLFIVAILHASVGTVPAKLLLSRDKMAIKKVKY
jgi:hypothetical protein